MKIGDCRKCLGRGIFNGVCNDCNGTGRSSDPQLVDGDYEEWLLPSNRLDKIPRKPRS